LENKYPSFFIIQEKNKIKQKTTSKLLRSELSKMGYSEKAIKEIGKWLPLE